MILEKRTSHIWSQKTAPPDRFLCPAAPFTWRLTHGWSVFVFAGDGISTVTLLHHRPHNVFAAVGVLLSGGGAGLDFSALVHQELAGLAVAVDSLASVRELVFEKKLVALEELVKLLDTDFAGRPDVLAAAKAAPKMGNADARADDLAKELVAFWGHAFDGKRNDRGGIFRPGTGSAMYYIWHARDVPASADGRLKGEPLSANYAPSLDVPVKGPVSVVRSFTEPDLGPVCNGGPLTIEIHDSAFAMPDGVGKVANLVKFFIERGGHQMQINTINRDTLLDAQAHPERHRHLIVRVWGWSGYFIELDKCFQDQIIKRVEL